MSELKIKPEFDSYRRKPRYDDRIRFQESSVRAILDQSNFAIYTLLAKVCEGKVYSNYTAPGDLGELEFSIKGALRCEMIDHPSYGKWRRLFGTNKSEPFPDENTKELPKSWRSRVLFRAFKNGQEAANYLNQSSLLRWESISPHPLSQKVIETSDRIVLLQVHDVALGDGRTFAKLLTDFLAKDSKILKLFGSCEHIRAFPSISGGERPISPAPLVILRFLWKGLTPLHSGYGQEFGEFVKEGHGEKISRNLETRRSPDQLADAFLATSVKGVFRTASAWLLEKIARQAGRKEFLTCDYSGAGENKPKACPVCRVYGGSGCRVGERYRQLSPVKFSFAGSSDAIHPDLKLLTYPFSHDYVDYIAGRIGVEKLRNNKLKIEALRTQEGLLLEVRIHPADVLSLALVCLSADLISSGFFRFGRFTSRGIGVVQLKPHSLFAGDLMTILGQDNVQYCNAEVDSGFALTQRLLNVNPLSVLQRIVAEYQ